MAIALVSSVTATPHPNGGTTGAIDTTGADLIVIGTADGYGTISSPSDSKGNTWTALTLSDMGSSGRTKLYYSLSPTVGTSHTFTYSGTSIYPAIMVAAFSGVSAYVSEIGATTSTASSIQPGNITPGSNDGLLLTIGSTNNASASEAITSPFTLLHSNDYVGGLNYGGWMAYEIQTTATARNPTWSGSSRVRTARMALWSAAGGGGTILPLIISAYNRINAA